MGLDLPQPCPAGKVDPGLQRLRVQVLHNIEVGVIVLFDGVELFVPADEIVLIAHEVERGGGKAPSVHLHVSCDIVVVGVGVQQLFQPLPQGHLHGHHRPLAWSGGVPSCRRHYTPFPFIC